MRAGGVLVVCALAGAIVARADAEPPTVMDMEGGGAWVASSRVGQMTLIDGGSAEVIASVAVGDPDGDLGAVQDGMVGYGVDRELGTVTRIDPTTFAAAAPVAVIDGARGDVSAHPAGDVVYVVDQGRGRVGVTDATAVSTLEDDIVSLAEPVSSAVVDDAGRLWTLGAGTGDLTWFDRTERRSRTALVEDPDGAELVVIDGRAALVERAGRTVRTLDGDGGFADDACLEIDPADTSVVVGGSPAGERLYVVSGDDGMLRVSDLATAGCAKVALEVADAGSELGPPTEAQDRVFIPDYTRGRVVIVDLAREEVVTTGEILAPGTTFELFARDGIVFYNDPASEHAGVIDLDGSVAEVAKYDPDDPGEGLDRDHDPDETATPDGTAPGPGDSGDPARPGEDPGLPGSDPEATDDSRAGSGSGPADSPEPDAGGPTGPDDARSPDATDPSPRGPGAGDGAPKGDADDGPIRIEANARVEVGRDLELTVVADEGELSDVTWTFGDGRTGEGTTVTHAWDAPDVYSVVAEATLDTVDGDPRRVTDTAGIEVIDRPASAPTIGAIASTVPGPYDDQTTYTFFTTITGDHSGCTWFVDGGAGTACRTVGQGPGLTRAELDQRFAPGEHTIRLEVEWTGGTVTADHTVTVSRALVPPDPQIAVSGATGSGGSYTAEEGTPITFDGSTTSGDYDRLEWRDGAGGAPVAGPVWSPTLGVGPHTIILTAVAPAFGNPQRSVTVTITARDGSGPTVMITLATGHPGRLLVTAVANDPESGVAAIDMYGTVTGECMFPDGRTGSMAVDFSTTAFASGTASEFRQPSDGSPGVEFDGYLDFPQCDGATAMSPDFGGAFWAVARNGAGLTTRSANHEFGA